ncbi:SRPBCC family protein [Streptomyces durbertensis]|uniref:SRPBCC family protein n=1 Tax=Streptomyces durbertensis TaxID=2448886 RepID=A0ABR6EHM5_9ACTN|nr:SRPBCC family protein [Streptomyces durbertensis]MBB1244470.1 SRPBCC family protein [Streptomyces durbertensis]
MRQVELEAVVRDARAEDVFDGVVRWDRYPELAPHVQETTVHATLPDPRGSSSWALHFRSGLLRWTEDEVFDRERLRVDFTQSEGDFDEFSGAWRIEQRGTDVSVRFTCDFDFGIPSLEGILDPIAERVIKETVAWAVTGMFERVELAEEMDLSEPLVQAATTTEG